MKPSSNFHLFASLWPTSGCEFPGGGREISARLCPYAQQHPLRLRDVAAAPSIFVELDGRE